MLRRAASNAYSWWWASHIRTNQSKWLENNLHEMDDRVKSMLKIIEEDADSFSKKAEMYFKKRPELVTFVEETYRAYRALAERYDHISGELHNANHTIANAFPDQVQFDTQDEGAADHLISRKKGNPSSDRVEVSVQIDRIQKEILVLQTEKEFIRRSYENTIARYQDIERQISSMQEELCLLQDEFGESLVIEDDEARTLMATAALRSCEETILSLQENQRRSAEFTRLASRRIMMAKEKLTSFKGDHEGINSEEEAPEVNQIPVQIGPDMSLVELAEKINELVSKVITLELTTTSQNAQIETLKTETDVLHKHLESLEEGKMALIEQKNEAYVFETTAQLVELKEANDMKDEEVRSMQKMRSKQDDSVPETSQTTSHVEENFRRDIDALLDENLDFWLRFSACFRQIRKFQVEFDTLKMLISGSVSSETEAIEKRLRELKVELQVWLEQNELLKGESQTRFNSLCNIHDEISGALASSLECDTVELSPYQAAKFQGEVSNMQHENNMVVDELQAGIDHVRGLRAEVGRVLSEKFELSSSSQGSRRHSKPLRYFPSKTHIPLRNFLFGVKPKKKPSIFRCVNPAFQKQYSDLSSGFPS